MPSQIAKRVAGLLHRIVVPRGAEACDRFPIRCGRIRRPRGNDARMRQSALLDSAATKEGERVERETRLLRSRTRLRDSATLLPTRKRRHAARSAGHIPERGNAMSRHWLFACLTSGVLGCTPYAAIGFALIFDAETDPAVSVRTAPRWNAEPHLGTGLHDGLQVAVHPDVAGDLEVAPDDVPRLEQAIEDAFGMWENDALGFEIDHGSALALRGTGVGSEIDVFTVPGGDPVFAGTSFFGMAHVIWEFAPDRLLSSGRRESGYVITGADIFLNATRLLETQQEFGLPIEIVALALTRLFAHEVGHTLGLGHPNEQRNFDYDSDPFDIEVVDAADPFSSLIASSSFDTEAILSNAPCGPVLQPCGALFFQALRPDDRLGRDVLYAVPEAGVSLLGSVAFGTLAALGLAHRGRGRFPSGALRRGERPVGDERSSACLWGARRSM